MDFNHWPVFIFLCVTLFDVALCAGPDVSNILLSSFDGKKKERKALNHTAPRNHLNRSRVCHYLCVIKGNGIF